MRQPPGGDPGCCLTVGSGSPGEWSWDLPQARATPACFQDSSLTPQHTACTVRESSFACPGVPEMSRSRLGEGTGSCFLVASGASPAGTAEPGWEGQGLPTSSGHLAATGSNPCVDGF